MILKGYKYRIYPNKTQRDFLEKHFGCARFIYNWGLNEKIKYYETTKKSISWIELQNKLPKLKKEFIWLNEIIAQSLQIELRNLDVAFKNFFRSKKGFPVFKSKKNNNKNFQIPQYYKIKNNKLYIPKLKDGIKIIQSRLYEGKEKTLTISKNSSGQYFATILVETNDYKIKPKKINEKTTIGIDLGIKDFIILSNGEKISNPKYLKKIEKRLNKKQKLHSKKQNGSKNKNKSRIKLAKLYNKIKNQRNDFLHKLSSRLISENQTICIENINTKKLMNTKNHILNKEIHNVAWSKFINQLNYKADWYGVNLITIGKFDPSSKMCNLCGNINKTLKLHERIWTCDCCKNEHDRDINAAINIKNFGLIKSHYPLLKLNTVGDTEINAC